MLALVVGTAATWSQVKKTEAQMRKTVEALRRKDAFIIESYPFFDRLAIGAIFDASKLFGSRPGSAEQKEAAEIFEQAISLFQQAAEMPPSDAKSREVIARAHTRLGYTRWMLSIARATQNSLEPRLLSGAVADFRRSIELLEQLHAESPDDTRITRYLAEALGLGGLGCCLRTALRPEEAEPLYRRSIEIRRQLLRGVASSRPGDRPGRADAAPERQDLSFLVNTVHVIAGMLEAKGESAEADELRRQLDDEVSALARRLGGPEYKPQRQMLARQLLMEQGPSFDQSTRRNAMISSRLALSLDPDNAGANNNLAWMICSVPGDPWFDPAQALALARKAVALEPAAWAYLNTLGVAAFRTRDWNTASDVLQQSITFTGGGAHDLFFLAMTYFHQGKMSEAHELYHRAVAWTDKNKPDDLELRRFQAEAQALLANACPPSPARAPRHQAAAETRAKDSESSAELDQGQCSLESPPE